MLVLALIVIEQTAQGDGPFASFHEHYGSALLEAQLYLAVASLLVLTASTLKTTRERVHEHAAVLQNNMGSRSRAPARSRTCSIRSRGGSSGAATSSACSASAWMHRRSRACRSCSNACSRATAMLRDYWDAEIAGEDRASLSLRIVQRDGGTQTITDHGAPLLDSNVDVTVVAGVWQLERVWPAADE